MLGHGCPEIFPQACACPRDLRRLLVRLARVARGGVTTGGDPAMLVEAICTAMIEQQRALSARVLRCSGPTLQRSPQPLLRLLRVRHLTESRGAQPTDPAPPAGHDTYHPLTL